MSESLRRRINKSGDHTALMLSDSSLGSGHNLIMDISNVLYRYGNNIHFYFKIYV